jgi:hypothetical protein
VRVRPPVAHAAADQPGQGEPASLAVTGWSSRSGLLSDDEALLGDERRMRGLR